MRLRPSFLLLLALLLSPAPAAAQVVYNGGAPNGGAGWDLWGGNRAADDFALSSTIGFDQIRFWGIRTDDLGAAYTPDLFWQILLDDGSGTPGTLVAGGNVAASRSQRTPDPFGSWQFDLLVGPQSLSAGIYWLALYDDALDSGLLWETSSGGRGDGFVSGLTFDPAWGPNDGSGNLAFELHDTTTNVVPEPVSMVLLGTGLAGVAAARRRRRKEPAEAQG